MADVPAQVTYGQVIGHFVRFLADSGDVGTIPDELPLAGSITLVPLTHVIRYPTTSPPRLAVAETVVCQLDMGGDLIGPDGSTGVYVIATNQPAGQPSLVQWQATFKFIGVAPQPSPVVFNVPTNGVVDLSVLVSVPPDPPAIIVVDPDSAMEAAQAAEDAQAAADAAEAAAAQAAADALNTVKVTTQTFTATQQGQARTNIAVAGRAAVGYFVNDYYPNPTPTPAEQHAALTAACTAASLVGGTVVLDPAVTKVVGSFKLAGFRCSIVGQGTATLPGGSGSAPMGSIIECVTQNGPVLDFTGFIPPKNQTGRLRFENFTVKGDGTADPSTDATGSLTVGGGTKKGIYIPSQAVYAATFNHLLITSCGGIHFDAVDMYLSDLYAVTVTDPISAAVNNVPYVRMRACNGIRAIGLGLRSVQGTGAASVGAAGAMRLEASALSYWDRAQFTGCWVENCWIPTGGAIIVTQTCGVAHRDWQFYDCFRVTGATNTSRIRLEPSSTGGTVAGNIVDGYIHGSPGGGTNIDYCVDVTQGRNRIQGIKGYPGSNVRLGANVPETFVFLGGAEGVGTTNPAVIDNSGRNDNTIIDTTVGLWQLASASGFTAAATVSGQHIRENRTATTISTAVSGVPDMSTGSTLFQFILASAGISIAAPTGNNQQERTLRIILRQDATGNRTVVWSGSYGWKSGSAPVLKTAGLAVDTFQFVYDSYSGLWQQI